MDLDLNNKTQSDTVPLIQITDVFKSFGSNAVLKGFNLTVDKGEAVVVLGKSGSGKSVLIKCMIGLLTPDAGRVEMFGQNVPDLTDEALDQLRANVGFLFQSNALYDSMTVRENLEFPLRRHWIKLTQNEVDQMVDEALEDVGLLFTKDMMPSELSGGMRKRIALARTLILKPEIILYDEPTTGLDAITGKEIIALMMEIRQKYGTTSVIISHDMHCVKMASTKVVVLIDGVCYTSGPYEEVMATTDPNVKAFFES